MATYERYLLMASLSPMERRQIIEQQSMCWINTIQDLIEFIDLKWNGIRVVSSSDDEFEVVEVLNNREEEQKKKKERKARKRQRTDEAIENERNLNGRNKNGLSQGR
ncbi:uncharacterized protein LOC117101750 isoform X2 [Anneissia japonica]|uniref:uncharacterized protein LOC117101750 isoform X2 n=1 Tax=Anneissia japonica TaxID=1529436 RepID=UPI0014258C71|nr:uncharacterized protein LOC117101750 isoform X2 [Anneissia japonica]